MYVLFDSTKRTILRTTVTIRGDLPNDPDDPHSRPWDDASKRRVIILGYYSWKPRRVVLFPNAIELVAGRQRYLDEFDGDIANARDALTRLVLVHELAHWFTLDPDEHEDRISLYGKITKEGPERLNERPMHFPEMAESLANLCTWFAFQHLAETSGTHWARGLLRTLYLTFNPAASYEYQLFWFWLAFPGIATSVCQLEGETIQNVHLEKLRGRVAALKEWARESSAEPVEKSLICAMVKEGFDPHPPEDLPLPGFSAASEGYEQAIGGLGDRWGRLYRKLKFAICEPGREGLLDT